MNRQELSFDAKGLLKTMQDGKAVLFRATTGQASYYSSAIGEVYCTRALEELKAHDLIEVLEIDKRVGWVSYVAKQVTEQAGATEENDEQN